MFKGLLNKSDKIDKENRPPRGRKPHSKKFRRIMLAVIAVLCVLGLLLISGGIYLGLLFSLVNYESDESVSYVDSLPPENESDMSVPPGTDSIPEEVIESGATAVSQIALRGNTSGITNILLLGIDSPDTGNGAFVGRSDTTIILTIDAKHKSIKLTSILRDTMVSIPGRDRNGDGKDDYAKFNAAFAYGGFDLLSKTIEQNFRLKIDKYIAVNFNAFEAVVNALGGVDMELTGDEAAIIGAGHANATYHLTGRQAREYSQIRVLDSDFGRTDRQRKMISALFSHAKTMNIGTLNSVLFEVLPEVRTNMSTNEFMGFTANALTYFSYTMQDTYHLPQQNEYTGKSLSDLGAVLVLNDPAKAVTALHQFIYN